VGEELGLPQAIVRRQPFPGPGLAIRIIGEVTAERLAILRAADAIAREEMSAAGLDTLVWQCPVVLLADVRSVGVQGDGRSYGHPVVLRPVTSEDAMTADWARLPDDVLARISTRVTNEVPEVNRVVLDVTSKPPPPSSGSNLPNGRPFPPRARGTARTQSQVQPWFAPRMSRVVRAARQTSVKRVVSGERPSRNRSGCDSR